VKFHVAAAAVEALRKKKRKDRIKLTLPPKIAGKTRLCVSQLFRFVKFSLPVTRFMAF
jgi:hypothetical protein